jgi:hypothetical protein
VALVQLVTSLSRGQAILCTDPAAV